MTRPTLFACMLVGLFSPNAFGVTNLLTNPGFFDTDGNATPEEYGTGWTNSGDVYFGAYFGAGNPHASLFADTIFHEGRLEQLGIAGTPGTTYQWDMFNMRIEANYSPDLRFGLEYYDSLDNKIGETKETADYVSMRAAAATAGQLDTGGALNGVNFSMQGTAVPGTVTVRPVLEYDNVQIGGNQANAFLFNTHMSVAPGVGDEALKNSGFEDTDDDGFLGDYWGSYGAAGFDDFFANGGPANGHASLYADTAGNSGGIYQKSILGNAGTQYEFDLTDVRIESNANGDFQFGFEYYAADDITKLGESLMPLDISTTGDGLSFSTTGIAVPGTVYVRPIVSYDNVLTTATESGVFIFDASMTELAPTPMGDADFDGDGDVDGNDFLIWQRGFGTGTTMAQGDANNSGTVDGADLAVWQGQYGVSGGPLAATTGAVPEPSAFLLVTGLLGWLATALRRVSAKSMD